MAVRDNGITVVEAPRRSYMSLSLLMDCAERAGFRYDSSWGVFIFGQGRGAVGYRVTGYDSTQRALILDRMD